MQLFDYEDYKAFITADLAANSKVRGYKTQLAGAAGCQKSFFSHVHRGHVHLTPDHASALSSFWRFDETETEYFLTLVDIARAGTPHLRARLQQRARRLRTEKGKFETQLKHSEQQEGLNQTFYYSSWYWSALHILASIPEFQTPAKMADRLGLDIRFVLEALKELEKNGPVKKNEGSMVDYGSKFSPRERFTDG